ncbi:MAG TPA: type II toxin-antitoxin system prevent-host-death family antitoxin [Candidatus Baltobacteraceae bacterium]|jgi:prevent-host-death family protein
MKAISARAARAAISGLLDAAEAGESTLIIRNSRPAAVIGPVPPEGRGYAYDPDEVRWYRARGARHKVGFLGAANAAFLALPRDARARALDAVAAIANDAPVLIVRSNGSVPEDGSGGDG